VVASWQTRQRGHSQTHDVFEAIGKASSRSAIAFADGKSGIKLAPNSLESLVVIRSVLVEGHSEIRDRYIYGLGNSLVRGRSNEHGPIRTLRALHGIRDLLASAVLVFRLERHERGKTGLVLIYVILNLTHCFGTVVLTAD
jgi:hypothetical protein